MLREFTEMPPYELVPFARRAAGRGVRNMDFIVDYTDSLLNWHQLQAWREDIPRALAEYSWTEVERLTAKRMLHAAEDALEFDGYLFIEA